MPEINGQPCKVLFKRKAGNRPWLKGLYQVLVEQDDGTSGWYRSDEVTDCPPLKTVPTETLADRIARNG